MSKKFVVGYDGSDESKRAVRFAASQAKAAGADLVVAHVLEWSPYSFLTPQELEERHSRRKEEMARAEKAVIAPMLEMLSDTGVKVEAIIKYGHVADTLVAVARDSGAEQVFIGRTGENGISARVFGSVAGNLAQTSPVPCTIVP